MGRGLVHFIPKRLRNEQVEETVEPSTDRSLYFPILDREAVYKYLGIEQKLGLKEVDAWDRMEIKCLQIVQKLWEADLTFRQKVDSYNSTVIPMITYVMGCIVKGSGKYISVLESGGKLQCAPGNFPASIFHREKTTGPG